MLKVTYFVNSKSFVKLLEPKMHDNYKEAKVFNNSTRLVRIGGEIDLALKNFNEVSLIYLAYNYFYF